jgi:hypothetical protein
VLLIVFNSPQLSFLFVHHNPNHTPQRSEATHGLCFSMGGNCERTRILIFTTNRIRIHAHTRFVDRTPLINLYPNSAYQFELRTPCFIRGAHTLARCFTVLWGDHTKITPCSVAEGHRAKFETSTDVEVITTRNLCHCPSVNCSRC